MSHELRSEIGGRNARKRRRRAAEKQARKLVEQKELSVTEGSFIARVTRKGIIPHASRGQTKSEGKSIVRFIRDSQFLGGAKIYSSQSKNWTHSSSWMKNKPQTK